MPETIPDSSGSSIATPMAPLLFTPLLLIEISVAPEFTRFGVLGMRTAVRVQGKVGRFGGVRSKWRYECCSGMDRGR